MSFVSFQKIYPGTALTMSTTALVNDTLVVCCGSNTLNVATATATGVGSLVAQQNINGTGSLANSATILTGNVTTSTAPGINTSADSDMGFGAFILRSMNSATKNAGSGNFGVGNPLTSTSVTSVQCTLIVMYLNESTNNFTSFTPAGITNDGTDTTHVDSYGHQLAMSSGTYTIGANVTSEQNNTVVYIFLPETAASTPALRMITPAPLSVGSGNRFFGDRLAREAFA